MTLATHPGFVRAEARPTPHVMRLPARRRLAPRRGGVALGRRSDFEGRARPDNCLRGQAIAGRRRHVTSPASPLRWPTEGSPKPKSDREPDAPFSALSGLLVVRREMLVAEGKQGPVWCLGGRRSLASVPLDGCCIVSLSESVTGTRVVARHVRIDSVSASLVPPIETSVGSPQRRCPSCSHAPCEVFPRAGCVRLVWP